MLVATLGTVGEGGGGVLAAGGPACGDQLVGDTDEARLAVLHSARLVYFNPTCHNPTALTLPRQRRADLATTLRSICLMGQPLAMALVSQLLLDGSAYALLAQVVAEVGERAWLAEHLLDLSLRARTGGLHAWCRVPEPWTEATFSHAAQLQNLAISPSSAFCPPGERANGGFRLSLGLATDRRQLKSALSRINQLVLSRELPTVQR